MLEKSRIEKIVFRAMDRVNEVLLDEEALVQRPETVLVGEGGQLDSMGFINFVVALEEELAKELGLNFNLVEQINASTSAKPATVAEFIEFVFAAAQSRASGNSRPS